MKVKVIRTGEVIEAKRFKNLTDEEKKSSCAFGIDIFEDNDIFVEPYREPFKSDNAWEYMLDREVEIIEEEI